jgi:hypothetical protein
MAKNTTTEPTLDEKIAKALSLPSATTSSAPLLALVVEVTSAIEVLDGEARAARLYAADPTNVDGIAMRSKAEDAEFRVMRYRNGLAGLQKLLDAAVAAEQSVAWNTDADRMQAERDHLAAEFRMRYPAIVDELISLFTAIGACDQAIDRLHAAAPATDNGRRLRKVEAEARDINAIALQGDASIIESTKLPRFAQHGVQLAWPLAKPSPLLGLLDIFPKNGNPDPANFDHYESFFDEAAGCYTMRRKPDAPPLVLPPAPPVMDSMRDQILAEQKSRGEGDERFARYMAEHGPRN